MASRDSTPGERAELIRCLEELSRRQGIWREDLIDLLQGKLSSLRRHWGVNLDEGIDVVRGIITATLNGHIRNLYRRRGSRPLMDKIEVERYRLILAVSFNTVANQPELREKVLVKRREWLAERSVASKRTSQRILDEAIEQIAERLASGVETPPVNLSIDSDNHPQDVRDPVVQNESQGGRPDWFLPFIPASSILIPAIVLSYAPATLWEPLKSADAVMPWLVGSCAVGWLLIRILTDQRLWWRLGSILLIIIVLATALVVIGHFWRYRTETAYARNVAAAARSGDIIFTDEFDRDGSCPAGQASDASRVLPLSSCNLSGGNLRAMMDYSPFIRMGIYRNGEGFFHTFSFDQKPKPLTYYIETRFRVVDETSLSACGISIDAVDGYGPPSRDRSLFFHLHKSSEVRGTGYAGEVLATFVSLAHYDEVYKPNVVFPRPYISQQDSLPFIGKASVPGWSNGTWTKLGVVLIGDEFVFLVDDRVVVVSKYPGLKMVNRATLSILTGGPAGGSAATCNFDHLHVRRLPS